MAYNKYTWVDGELITAEKLNHMEDGIADAGGGGEVGYKCTETTEELFSETVTTEQNNGVVMANLFYSERLTADELTVIFNGTQYVCPKIISYGAVYYGGANEEGDLDFTNYPFCICSTSGSNVVATESPMTVTVGVSIPSSMVETTECFRRAVESVLASILYT